MIPETAVDARPDGGGFPGFGEPPVTTILTVDGVEYSIFADPTMASLKAIRASSLAGRALNSV